MSRFSPTCGRCGALAPYGFSARPRPERDELARFVWACSDHREPAKAKARETWTEPPPPPVVFTPSQETAQGSLL